MKLLPQGQGNLKFEPLETLDLHIHTRWEPKTQGILPLKSPGSGFGFSVPAGGYDQEDRLTAWNRTDGARNQSWTLSAVGDWTAHSDAGVSQTRTHAAAHELTAVTTGGTTSPLG